MSITVRIAARCAAVLLGCALALAQGPTPATIVLPNKVVAGQTATLAVLGTDGRLAPGIEVEFSGGERKTTDATGRLTWTAPAEAGVLMVQLPGGRAVATTTVVAAPGQAPDRVQLGASPSVVPLHDRFTVVGSGFRGEADANRVTLGEQPALVLAASPLSLVVLPGPRTPVGSVELLVEVGGRSPGPVPVRVLALELNADKPRLAPREKGRLVVRVRGTEGRVELEARNLSPEAVRLRKGDVQRLRTSGGADNTAEIEVEGRRAGDFSISVRLVPPPAGLPDVESARQKLLAARHIAPSGWGWRVDDLIRRLESRPQETHKVRDRLEKLLTQGPPGEFGRLLEAAWRILIQW
jgi:hypothetical protein